ncbi:MAG: hypothetical protein ACFWTK_08405 [Clostridium sp.]
MFTLPELPYDYNALEPYYDEETVRIHHDKHHQGYVDGLNKAEAKLQEAREAGDFALIKHWERELAKCKSHTECSILKIVTIYFYGLHIFLHYT